MVISLTNYETKRLLMSPPHNQIVAVAKSTGLGLTPSTTLLSKINSIVNSFGKLTDKINEALEVGRSEGLTDFQTGQLIRAALLQAGYDRRTTSRLLPKDAKALPRGLSHGHGDLRDKMSQNSGLTQTQLLPENYQTEALEYYPKAFLIQIIHYLEEKQQKQVVKSVVHEIKAIDKVNSNRSGSVKLLNTNVVSNLPSSHSKAYYSPQLASDSPRQVTINECLTILQDTKSMVFEDLIKQACQQNPQIAAYIGDKYLMKHNVKLRPIIQQLLGHGNVKRTNQKPIVLSWI